MEVSRKAVRLSKAGLSGRGNPCGGIAPTCSLRMTFSQVSAFFGTSLRFAAWRERPPVRSLSLWQVTQYLSRSADWAAGLDWALSGSRARVSRTALAIAKEVVPERRGMTYKIISKWQFHRDLAAHISQLCSTTTML